MARPDHSKEDFRNKSKVGADFRKHNLYMARFEFSNFPNSDFSAASAKQCCFIRANLAGSNFTGANLYGANFGGADLRGVNFRSAILHHVNFENALIHDANFTSASIKMCKKLKLSNDQLEQIEQIKKLQREVSAKDLEVRKSSPEYQEKKLNSILKKPWVEAIRDEREKGGGIVIVLKYGYEFLDGLASNIQSFETVDSAQAGTTKKSVNQIS
ncbi:pentapeptide repeat-containing protein [Gluconacetobacter tumulicola]|uniref:Pentapeptide repeat-containing protein n=1 Tax=Gluconacetobacter tumulicola TaxID=1017177 RepID=A0A7W4JCE7_9PROT|nr:pentapeptide repeat-containing protein [Gluconacetobacter tumulicola]MBB2178656.1 hypothetical protein [Gluconacetobacter tumulicola]